MSDTPDIERALVYTPRDGDRLVLEVNASLDRDELFNVKEWAEETFGCEVIVLHGAHLAGIVRHEVTP